MELYLWHGIPCSLLTRSPFKKGIKRNALIQFSNGKRSVVPWRSLRRPKDDTAQHHFHLGQAEELAKQAIREATTTS